MEGTYKYRRPIRMQIDFLADHT